MNVEIINGAAHITGIAFSAEHTLFCGQTFLWHRVKPGCYAAAIRGQAMYLSVIKNGFTLWPCDESSIGFWLDYFDLHRDYDALLNPYAAHEVFGGCISAFRGLRVLNQNAWETLCTFILSANNNEKRITSLVRALCENLGDRVESSDIALYTFPGPNAICRAGEEALRKMGMGYRAKYILGSAQMVREGFDLDALMHMPYEEALKQLTRLPGVGEKVADCVLLFSLKKAQAFPVDVWMERALTHCFGLSGNRHSLKQQAYALFGDEAGILQQYLFHGARQGLFAPYFGGEGV